MRLSGVLLLVSAVVACLVLNTHGATRPSLPQNPEGVWVYCELPTQTQRHAGEWVIYFSDVFFQTNGHGDVGKEWRDYIQGKYPVDPHDTAQWCGTAGRGATEATTREDKAKKVKYDSGQIVETGWKQSQN
jgi:hypothetical protein